MLKNTSGEGMYAIGQTVLDIRVEMHRMTSIMADLAVQMKKDLATLNNTLSGVKENTAKNNQPWDSGKSK